MEDTYIDENQGEEVQAEEHPAIDFSNPPTAYCYAKETGEFIGTEPCQPDPLESKKEGKAVWLLPANATLTAPATTLSGDASTVRWQDGAWAVVEDHRQHYDEHGVKTGGTPYWLPEDKHDSNPRYMTELGPLPDGALLEAPEMPLDQAKQEKIGDLARSMYKFLAMGHVASSLGFEVNADRDALSNVQGLIAQGVDPVEFRDYDNQMHQITQNDLATLQGEIFAAIQQAYQRKWKLLDAIDACEDKAALDAITWDDALNQTTETTAAE